VKHLFGVQLCRLDVQGRISHCRPLLLNRGKAVLCRRCCSRSLSWSGSEYANRSPPPHWVSRFDRSGFRLVCSQPAICDGGQAFASAHPCLSEGVRTGGHGPLCPPHGPGFIKGRCFLIHRIFPSLCLLWTNTPEKKCRRKMQIVNHEPTSSGVEAAEALHD
jgi:hypothetical protein